MTSNNNNIKNWKSTAIWSAITVGILLLWMAAVQKQQSRDIEALKVVIKSNEGQRLLISRKDVKRMIKNRLGYDVRHANLGEINLRDIEELLERDGRVKRAEVFVDKGRSLRVFILQKEPIVRIIEDKKSYYLDEEGKKMPVHKGRAARIPVATGNVGKYDFSAVHRDKSSSLWKIYHLAKAIRKDDFLAALVEQIDVNDKGFITIVPKVGDQVLEMRMAEDIDEQLGKLKIFYRKGIHNVGWRQHSKFRLDVKGQVIGKKKHSSGNNIF